MNSRRALGFVAVSLLATRVQAAEEALDAEFLDYLATLESDDEDWTWFWEEREADENDTAAKPAKDEAQ